jgi:arylsulfatase
MNSFTESTWIVPVMGEEIKKLMESYVKYPPRKMQSMSYDGPITLSGYQKFEWIREQLQKEGVKIPLPTGN